MIQEAKLVGIWESMQKKIKEQRPMIKPEPCLDRKKRPLLGSHWIRIITKNHTTDSLNHYHMLKWSIYLLWLSKSSTCKYFQGPMKMDILLSPSFACGGASVISFVLYLFFTCQKPIKYYKIQNLIRVSPLESYLIIVLACQLTVFSFWI